MLKVQATLNSILTIKEIPTQWEDVTFGAWLEAGSQENKLQLLAHYFGISEETLKKCRIKNLDLVLDKLSFLSTGMDLSLPKTILGYPVPENLEAEATGQYEDARLVLAKFKPQETNADVIDNLKFYPELVSIFAMPNYLDAKPKEQDEFSKQFFNAPVQEVLAIGNFTIKKLLESNLNIPIPSPKPLTPLRKFRLALIALLKRWAFTERYKNWNKRFHSIGTSSSGGQ